MVDPIMSDHLSDLMLRLKKQLNLTSVVVTHDLDLMYKAADRVVFLFDGKVISTGRPPASPNRTTQTYTTSWKWIGWFSNTMRILMVCCLVGPWMAAAQTTPGEWKSAGVVDVRRSPYAKLQGVPVHAVTMGDGFWAARRKANVEKSIPTMLTELEEHGIVDNFLRLEGKKNVPRHGPLYTDSDVYKWMEAAAFCTPVRRPGHAASGIRPAYRSSSWRRRNPADI